MDQCARSPIRFAPPVDRPLAARFEAGRRTSGGGLGWLREAADDLGGCAPVAGAGPGWRRGAPPPPLGPLVTPRVFAIAGGDADQTDATARRRDPVRKLVGGRRPSRAPDRARQPTRSRLATAVHARACSRLAWARGQ